MWASTPLSEGRALPSSLLANQPRSSKTKHSSNYGFKKMTSLSNLQHPFQYWTPAGKDGLAHTGHADSRPGLFRTPSSIRSPSSFDAKMKTTPEKSMSSVSGFQMALATGNGVSTPCHSETAGDSSSGHSRTPEPPSPVNPPSQSSLQWLRGSLEKNSASLSRLKASVAAVASFTPQPSPVSVLGPCSDATGPKLSSHSSIRGSKGTGPRFSSKNLTTPPLFRKCKDDPQLFNLRLQLSDDSDDEKEPGSQPVASAQQKSHGPKRYPSTCTQYKECPPSTLPQSSVHNRTPAKVPISGLSINGAHSGQPRQLQQQHSLKRGCLPPKALHSAKADALLPCRLTPSKNQPGNTYGRGLPVKDAVSDGKCCHAVLEENDGVLHNNQPDDQQALEVPLHSKKRSLLSVLLDVQPPVEHFYIEVNRKKYHMLSVIGKGGSSKVFMMFNHRKELCAVKLVSLANVQPSVMQAYMQEVAILKALRSCGRVVRLYDCELNTKDKVLALVMEKGDQDLATVLTNRQGDLGPVTIKFYWSEMLQAVKEIHQKRVIHSDLKPANFLFVAGKLKLIDFGIAATMQEDVTSVYKESPMGTLNFMSPESIQYTCHNKGKDYLKIGLKSDVWSLGCILYNLVYGRTPFQHISGTHAKLLAIADKNQVIEFPDVSDPHLMDVLKRCLRYAPEQRPSISELLAHPYLAEENVSLALKQCKNPHLQSLFSEIENLSPASVKKMKEVLKSLRKDKP
ncbi:uncharacterized protein Mps1 [Dermacentor andersoni]|uniref:uncharacterized protein Mps1 n=1 Tax=Dermacentor andersoni TaxID=34620 RepID=UPI002155B1DD|nr:uncharacterized protein LOC126547900 [Dermacentor andersoni]XP_054919694.1 uncharacterized protein LOC126547900 [Dermacentor andersoni]XP_054919695.1 uncharacterized protein LOC126547900 [Dermacentor andersoni]